MGRNTKLIKGKGRLLVVAVATVAFLLSSATLVNAFSYRDLHKAFSACFSASQKLAEAAEDMRTGMDEERANLVKLKRLHQKNVATLGESAPTATKHRQFPLKRFKAMQKASKRAISQCKKSIAAMNKSIKLD